jgi:hypothetical protein
MAFGKKEKSTITGLLGQTLDNVMVNAQVNQIRGVSVAGNLGAGIPKQVTAVAASVKNASAGSTSVVTVTFLRDPSDSNFSTANVYLKNYNGNPAQVVMASGADSPISFVVNSTGESVVVLVQSVGNAGSAPIGSCPTTGIRLPQSTSGGFGSSSNPGITGTGTAGALAVWTGKATLGGGNLSSDATTSSGTSVTVRGIQTVSVSDVTPAVGDTFRYSEYGDGKYDLCIGVPRNLQCLSDGGSATPYSVGWSSAPVTIGTRSLYAASATEPGGCNIYNIAGVGSTSDIVCLEQVFGASTGSLTYGCFRRFSSRILLGAGLGLTNSRFWGGLTATAPQFGTTAYSTNTYGASHACAAFRYCNGVDTNIQAVVGNGSAQTVSDTGIAPDQTNSQVFDIVRDGSSQFRFFINGALVATISATMPSASSLWGTVQCVGDNQNHANNIGFTVVTVK